MGSIGELFIQLAVMGNANELKKANAELQKSNILTQKQEKLDKARAEALEKVRKAQTLLEKKEIVKRFHAKKEKIEQEARLRSQLAEAKALKANIAQWATYAHMVQMAVSSVVNGIKKIKDEIEKTETYKHINNSVLCYGKQLDLMSINFCNRSNRCVKSSFVKWKEAFQFFQSSI